jgi:hypothetical protein
MVEIKKTELPEGFNPPKDKRGHIRWASLQDNPELLKALIESETQSLIESGVELNFRSLLVNKRSNLSAAIRRYYPGGLFGVQETFGIATKRKPKPKGHWQKDNGLEVKREVQQFFEQFGEITFNRLVEEKRTELIGAIRDYPGGWVQLKRDLNLKVKIVKHGFWSPEQIRDEARQFVGEFGKITTAHLCEAGRFDLNAAITRKYPGGIVQLKQDLGIQPEQRRNKYWKDPANIEAEAIKFYDQHGWITQNLMLREGRSDLWSAIIRYYPGRIKALREKLNLQQSDQKVDKNTANNDLTSLFE